MPKKLILIFTLFLSVATSAAIRENFHLQAKLEQVNLPITKSFSIRAKSINQVLIRTSKSIKVSEVYIELSDGTFLNLDTKKLTGKLHGKWKIRNKHIKTITFTARTNSKKNNSLEFVLTR